LLQKKDIDRPVIPALRWLRREDGEFEVSPGNNIKKSQKKKKKTEDTVQVEEHLLCKHKALSSKPQSHKKKTKQYQQKQKNNKPHTNVSKGQVLVAHACNPSYSGGRDQEDRGLKAAQANVLRDSTQKNSSHKKG
jgi:hypothetical protein